MKFVLVYSRMEVSNACLHRSILPVAPRVCPVHLTVYIICCSFCLGLLCFSRKHHVTVNPHTTPVQERLCDVLSRTDVPPGYVYGYCNSMSDSQCHVWYFLHFLKYRRNVLECLSSPTIRLSIPGSNDARLHKYARDVIQGRYHIKRVTAKPGLWTGPWTGLWTGLDYGLAH